MQCYSIYGCIFIGKILFALCRSGPLNYVPPPILKYPAKNNYIINRPFNCRQINCFVYLFFVSKLFCLTRCHCFSFILSLKFILIIVLQIGKLVVSSFPVQDICFHQSQPWAHVQKLIQRSVNKQITVLSQMPKFFDLCSDSLWGIRKACAECFMVVSNCTSPEVRRTKLSPLFINLISDQSRWVRHFKSTVKIYSGCS